MQFYTVFFKQEEPQVILVSYSNNKHNKQTYKQQLAKYDIRKIDLELPLNGKSVFKKQFSAKATGNVSYLIDGLCCFI